jgi:hypothetical protein
VLHYVGMLCLLSPTVMARMLDNLRTLRTVLLTLGYSEPPLFISAPRLLHGNSYLWCVWVITYERPTTDHIRRNRHVVETTTPRWTFEGGMREAAREAFALL